MSVGATNPMNNGGRTRGKPDSVIRCNYSSGQPPNYYLPNKKHLPARKLQDFLEDIISIESRKKICKIIEDVSTLTDIEKLFVYLQLPTGKPADFDPLKIPQNPLGSRFEVGQTITWIQTHFEEDPSVSLPKQEVYDDYMNYCSLNNMKLLSMADFGKVMKQAFPDVRPRRLGTRGNSRYCYAGLQKKMNLPTPMLPDLGAISNNNNNEVAEDTSLAAWCLVKEWAEKTLKHPFKSVMDLAYYLISHSIVDSRSIGAMSIITAAGQGTGIVPGSSKQNDARIQLGLKLQERERQQEEKRKHQEPNTDLQSSKSFKNGKPSGKKVRLGRSNSCAGKSSDLMRWPQKGEPPRAHTAVPDLTSETVICPKVPAQPSGLPPSSSHSCANVHMSPSKAVGKVPIPRLSTATSMNNIVLGLVPKTQFTPVPKYKPIQPKPLAKDSLLKRRVNMETIVSRKEGKFEQEEIKNEAESCDAIELSDQNDEFNLDPGLIEHIMSVEKLTEEKLDDEKLLDDEMDSIFRDKTDEQRHKPEDLSKLRNLLADCLPKGKLDNRGKPNGKPPHILLQSHLEPDCHALKMRRVSFEPVSQSGDVHLVEQHTNGGMVPQSPNTRRRSFNFQPIDPGCMSPNADASPFMSPHGTPSVKSRHNSGQSNSYVTTRGTPMSTLSDTSRTTLDSTPFVSPLTTPIPPGSRSRHLSTQDLRTLAHSLSHPQLAIGKRSRNTSGGIMTQPRTLFSNTAPQSPNVPSGEQEKLHFNLGEPVGRVRSRHNSAGGNPQSPMSAPHSPSVSGPSLTGDGVGNDSMLRSILRDNNSIKTDSRRRHWSAFAESTGTPAGFYTQEPLCSQPSALDESIPNVSAFASRCQSVPLYQMIQTNTGMGQEFSNPSTPLIGQPFELYNPVNYHTPEESVHSSCAGTPVPPGMIGQQSELVLDQVNTEMSSFGVTEMVRQPINAESSQSLDVDLFNRMTYENQAPPLLSSRSQPATPLPGSGGFLLDVGSNYQQTSASHSYPSTPVNVPNTGEQFLRSSSSQQLLFTGTAPAPGMPMKPKSETLEQSQLKVDLDEGYDFEAESDFNQLVNEMTHVPQDEDQT